MSPPSPWYAWCLLSWPALPREGQPPGPPSGAALAQPQCHCLLFQASMSSLPSPYPTNVVNCGRTGTRAFSGREDPKTSNNSIPTTLAKTRLFCLMGEGWGNGAFSRGSRLPWSMSPNPEFQPARQTAHRQGFSMPEERGGWELFPLSQVRKSGTGDRPSSFLSLSLSLSNACPTAMPSPATYRVSAAVGPQPTVGQALCARSSSQESWTEPRSHSPALQRSSPTLPMKALPVPPQVWSGLEKLP